MAKKKVKYKEAKSGFFDQEEKKFIPDDPRNADFQKFKEWQKKGNKAEKA